MTRGETIKILAVLKGAYPGFYRTMAREELEGVVGLWQSMFEQEEYGLVAAAVKAHIAGDEKGYPPHIGAIKARIYQLRNPLAMTEAEAWRLVRRAASNGYYDAEREFAALPGVIRRLVGSPDQLRQWALVDADTLETVVGSNFQRSYREAARQEKDLDMLPETVREQLGSLSKQADTRQLDAHKEGIM